MNSSTTKFYIFSGLPASGKTSLAKRLANHLKATYLRIDTIEHGLKELCNFKATIEGYRLTYRIAKDNLINGVSVIADSCNPIQLTRNEWENVAAELGVDFVNIEISCSDRNIHRARALARKPDIENFKLPPWEAIENRQYEAWPVERCITIDTANDSEDESFAKLLNLLFPPA